MEVSTRLQLDGRESGLPIVNMNNSSNNIVLEPGVYFVKTVQEFKQIMRAHEARTNTRYAFRCGPNSFTKKMMTFSTKSRLHWHEKTPFFHFGTRFYVCHQGKDNNVYQKKKYAQKREAMIKQNSGAIGKCHTNRKTKKVGCPAAINVTRMYLMSSFKLTTKFNHKAKTKVSLAIKASLAKGVLVDGEELYRFNLPDANEHQNHTIGESVKFSKAIDPRLLEKIKAYVRGGKTNATTISKQLEDYVTTQLQEMDKTRSEFYPNIETIKNAISDAKQELWSSRMDLEATQKMLERWDVPSENLFFSFETDTSSRTDEMGGSTSKLTAGSDSQSDTQYCSMRFVYQDNNMRHLYQRYGSNTLLLEPVYRSCSFSIPVYFLVVQTNVGCVVVGIVIIQPQNQELLCKALAVFQGWNPQVKPKYGLVDISKDEIAAMETAFPDLAVFISSFYCKQAWSMWSRRKKRPDVGEAALDHLLQVSNATTEELLQQALAQLQSLPFYTTTSLKSYFEPLWLNEIRRWALVYKPDDLLFNVDQDQNEGSLNEQIGYKHLEKLKNCLLSQLITNLLEGFIPESYSVYVQKNLKIVSENDGNLPKHLQHRPKWLVEHTRKVCELAEQLDEVRLVAINRFSVHSSTCQESTHFVSFDPTKGFCCCTCYEYRRTGLVCSHIVCVGMRHPEWSLPKIHKWLFSNPIYTYDDVVASFTSVEVMDNSCVLGLTTNNVQTETMITDSVEELPIHAVHEFKPSAKSKGSLIEEVKIYIQCIKAVLGFLDTNVLADIAVKCRGILEGLPTCSKLDATGSGIPENAACAIVSKLSLPAAVKNVGKVEKTLSPVSINSSQIIKLQTLQPDLYNAEFVIDNVVFDYDVPLPPVGAVATVESVDVL